MDFLSKLPDVIRNYIVSFLSMEDAVRTSVLSKQWRDVCSSLPRFEFHQNSFEEKTNMRYDFMDFVDQVISRHHGSSIEEFSLCMTEEDLYEDARILSWITFALKHKVKNLTIEILKFNSLPDCLFTCESLTHLYLRGVTVNAPAEFKFPNLWLLWLQEVEFIGDTDNQANQVVVKCLLLESLTFICSSWKNIDDLIIRALNLKSLAMIFCDAHNVELHCPHLRQFNFSGHPSVINPESLLSLCSASFSCPSSSAQDVVDHQCVSKIVMGLSNVVSLSLDEVWFQSLSSNGDIISNQALLFYCLEELSVEMFANENQVHFMSFLFKIYPNLKNLDICFKEQDGHTDMLSMGGYRHQKKLSNGDSLERLEMVCIDNFEGSNYELYLIEYLLENAKILEEIEITFSKKFNEDEPHIRSITEKITQIVAISPYVTTNICSLKERIHRIKSGPQEEQISELVRYDMD